MPADDDTAMATPSRRAKATARRPVKTPQKGKQVSAQVAGARALEHDSDTDTEIAFMKPGAGQDGFVPMSAAESRCVFSKIS
jgi:hypothetical protein